MYVRRQADRGLLFTEGCLTEALFTGTWLFEDLSGKLSDLLTVTCQPLSFLFPLQEGKTHFQKVPYPISPWLRC